MKQLVFKKIFALSLDLHCETALPVGRITLITACQAIMVNTPILITPHVFKFISKSKALKFNVCVKKVSVIDLSL